MSRKRKAYTCVFHRSAKTKALELAEGLRVKGCRRSSELEAHRKLHVSCSGRSRLWSRRRGEIAERAGARRIRSEVVEVHAVEDIEYRDTELQLLVFAPRHLERLIETHVRGSVRRPGEGIPRAWQPRQGEAHRSQCRLGVAEKIGPPKSAVSRDIGLERRHERARSRQEEVGRKIEAVGRADRKTGMPPCRARILPSANHSIHEAAGVGAEPAPSPEGQVNDVVSIEVVLQIEVRKAAPQAQIKRVLDESRQRSVPERRQISVLCSGVVVDSLRENIVRRKMADAHVLSNTHLQAVEVGIRPIGPALQALELGLEQHETVY